MANIENIRHSLAHTLAHAIQELYPEVKFGIGPVIENGFYYDFEFPKTILISEQQLLKIEKVMRELIKKKLDFTGEKIEAEEAKTFFKNQPFKLELIEEFIKEERELSRYTVGEFTDLCKGGHVENTSEIDPEAFKLTKVSGAYWRGLDTNPMLTRIYGVAFATKKELENYLLMLEEAKKRDHKKLGIEMDLFTFSDLVGAGLPLWTPKGTLVRNLLDDFVWQLRKKYGYNQVDIPHITKKDLYEASGHWEKFQHELFQITTREGHLFAMKPMNCPHHTQIYARKKWSYRELPQRYANTTKVYRDEQTGELSGLSRARSFTQDDAHVFCRIAQVKEEALNIWDIIHDFYSAFGFELSMRLSTHDPEHPEKYLGDKSLWQSAENILKDIIKTKKVKALSGVGEAAFYGPKLDFLAKDSLGREWQIATIQIDMNMPERFNLTCTNEKGEQERIVMIHAAIMGSIERFLSVAIEHFGGHLPLWLAPEQIWILPISEKQTTYAKQVAKKLIQEGFRIVLKDENETLGKKIREAETQKIPYLLILGDKEKKAKSISIRSSQDKNRGSKIMDLEKFILKAKKEIAKKQ